MNLPLDNHRIDDCPTVTHRHKTAYMYQPGAPVDINYTDIAAERVREVGRIIVVHRLQPWLQVWRALSICRQPQVLNGLALGLRSLHIEAPTPPLHVLLTHFPP